ncbi:PCC domain-containing protein [Bradyrhizobium sp. PMVTL-01]|uniref:PCC domain-containing protein n=1 Tax=Bradyrhizobium sp. PMVTL-01 TaxID=3434999 RepID=UPI003F712B1E
MLKGKIEEIIYAQLEHGEDLLRGIWDVCTQNDVKTGILLDATGCMKNLRLHKISKQPDAPFGVDFAEIPGPLEVSAHGIIGMGWVPDKSLTPQEVPGLIRSSHDTGFGGSGFVGHESPYCHVHITGSSSSQTICGHLLEGSLMATHHFEIVIAKVSGVILRMTWDKRGYPAEYYHELVRA